MVKNSIFCWINDKYKYGYNIIEGQTDKLPSGKHFVVNGQNTALFHPTVLLAVQVRENTQRVTDKLGV